MLTEKVVDVDKERFVCFIDYKKLFIGRAGIL